MANRLVVLTACARVQHAVTIGDKLETFLVLHYTRGAVSLALECEVRMCRRTGTCRLTSSNARWRISSDKKEPTECFQPVSSAFQLSRRTLCSCSHISDTSPRSNLEPLADAVGNIKDRGCDNSGTTCLASVIGIQTTDVLWCGFMCNNIK